MDGRTTSNRELARRIGVSETAVRRAEKAGRVKRDADGSWDLARVMAAWASNTDEAQQRRKPGAQERSGRPARMKPVPEAALGAVRDTLREHGEPIVTAPGQAMTFMQARTANEVLKAQERRVRLQRMKGELVDRARAVAQVFKLARDERDAWVNWPARVAAMMAAELEVDTHNLHTVLERHVRDHLAELAEIRPSLR
jgi:DNA-binding XRE family transcriptional regulator